MMEIKRVRIRYFSGTLKIVDSYNKYLFETVRVRSAQVAFKCYG